MKRKRFVFTAAAFVVVGLAGLQPPDSLQAAEGAAPNAAGLAAPAAPISAQNASESAGAPSVTYEDPFEQAFTVDVPRGWSVKGGAFRIGYSDVRPMVDMTSPDGNVEVRLGDVAIPTYALPTPSHPPGDHVDLGAQAQMTSARYHTGQDFATAYAQMHFIHSCQKLVPQQSGDAASVNDYLPADPGAERSTAGQSTYACTSPQGPRIAYAYARTNLRANLWQVVALGSFLAPPDRVAAARDVLNQAARSFRLSPQWVARQQQEDAAGFRYQQMRQQQRLYELGRQVQQFEQQMRAMQNQVSAFERGQARQAAQVKSFTNALNGITPTIDPYGNERDVWTGPHANYWRNGLGTVVNSTSSPGPGWTQLKPEE